MTLFTTNTNCRNSHQCPSQRHQSLGDRSYHFILCTVLSSSTTAPLKEGRFYFLTVAHCFDYASIFSSSLHLYLDGSRPHGILETTSTVGETGSHHWGSVIRRTVENKGIERHGMDASIFAKKIRVRKKKYVFVALGNVQKQKIYSFSCYASVSVLRRSTVDSAKVAKRWPFQIYFAMSFAFL